MLSSYADVGGIVLDNPEPHDDLVAGDLVTNFGSSFPVFEIVAVSNGRAWLRRWDMPHVDGLTSTARLKRLPPAGEAD